MDSILGVVPWPIYALAILAAAVLVVARNSLKLRKEFGKEATLDELRKRHPHAKIIWRSKKSDPHP